MTTALYQTGYFSNFSKSSTLRSKVHVIRIGGSPLCNSHIGGGSLFEWCAGGIYLPYVECETCKKLALRLQATEESAGTERKAIRGARRKEIEVDQHYADLAREALNKAADDISRAQNYLVRAGASDRPWTLKSATRLLKGVRSLHDDIHEVLALESEMKGNPGE